MFSESFRPIGRIIALHLPKEVERFCNVIFGTLKPRELDRQLQDITYLAELGGLLLSLRYQIHDALKLLAFVKIFI